MTPESIHDEGDNEHSHPRNGMVGNIHGVITAVEKKATYGANSMDLYLPKLIVTTVTKCTTRQSQREILSLLFGFIPPGVHPAAWWQVVHIEFPLSQKASSSSQDRNVLQIWDFLLHPQSLSQQHYPRAYKLPDTQVLNHTQPSG